MTALFIAGIIQALFFCVLLIARKGFRSPAFYLATILLGLSFSLFLNCLYAGGLIVKMPDLIGLDTSFPFLYGPLLYFYTLFMLETHRRFTARDLPHFLPFLVYLIYVFITFYSRDGQSKLEFLHMIRHSALPPDLIISNYLKIIQALIYILFIRKRISRHQNYLKDRFSSLDQMTLNWMSRLSGGMGLVYLIKLCGFVLSGPLSVSPGRIESFTDIAIVLFIYLIAFEAFRQPEIFRSETLAESGIPESKNLKYTGSSLSSEDGRQLANRIRSLMTEQQLFLQNELSLRDLAIRLNVNSKYISQVINEQLGKNFFTFINEYRIEEVKRKLADRNFGHLSILGIALDSGFNSKSSFNSIFKQSTGQTPSQYLQTLSRN